MRALIVALSLALATRGYRADGGRGRTHRSKLSAMRNPSRRPSRDSPGAVRDRDAAAVAGWVEYPITVNPGTGRLVVENAEDFVAHYDDIVTDDVFSAVDAQAYGDLFVNAGGVMLATRCGSRASARMMPVPASISGSSPSSRRPSSVSAQLREPAGIVALVRRHVVVPPASSASRAGAG